VGPALRRETFSGLSSDEIFALEKTFGFQRFSDFGISDKGYRNVYEVISYTDQSFAYIGSFKI
jgi:hypothetical protein